LEPGQLLLVLEALHERKKFLDTAPYLTDALPIVTPCFSWWEIPYYWAGLKVYDLMAVGRHLYSSYYLSRAETLRQFPMLNQEGLKGGVVYYDGQMNDARVNVSLAVTAGSYEFAIFLYIQVKKASKLMPIHHSFCFHSIVPSCEWRHYYEPHVCCGSHQGSCVWKGYWSESD
jgi:glycerol-3-phosphate dehydrogenase